MEASLIAAVRQRLQRCGGSGPLGRGAAAARGDRQVPCPSRRGRKLHGLTMD